MASSSVRDRTAGPTGRPDESRVRAPAGSASAAGPAYRWVVLGIALAAFLVTFLDRLVWTNVSLLASQSLGVPLAALGVFVTAFYVGYVVANVAGGVLADRFGPRRTLGLVLIPLGAATFGFGQVSSFGAGLAMQALMGVFAGADYAACVKVIASWFAPSERGRAFGLFSTAPSVGVALANGIFPTLLQDTSWRTLYAVLGALTLGVAALCLLGLRDRPPALPVSQAAAPAGPAPVRLVLRNPALVVVALAGFGANWGTWGFAFWATVLMVRGHGLSPVDAGMVATVFGVAAIVAKPLYGLLSDLAGGRRRILVVLDLLVFAASLLVFGWQDTKLGFLLVAPVLGVAAFVYSPLLAAMITEAVEPTVVGTATGVSNAFWQLGSVIVPSVVGLVFGSTGSFSAAFLVLAAGPLAGAACMLAGARRRACSGVKGWRRCGQAGQ